MANRPTLPLEARIAIEQGRAETFKTAAVRYDLLFSPIVDLSGRRNCDPYFPKTTLDSGTGRATSSARVHSLFSSVSMGVPWLQARSTAARTKRPSHQGY